MKVNGIGNHKNINDFVKYKIKKLETGDKNFLNLFELMFSEKENIMYEYSLGYRVVKKTYGEVYKDTLILASGLKNRIKNIEKGSVIGIFMENGIEWIELFWAVIICGYNPILMNMRLEDEVLERTLKENNTALVISEKKMFETETVLFSDIVLGNEELKSIDCATEVLVMSSGTSQHVKICAYTAEEFYYQICGSLEIIEKCPQMKAHYCGDLKLLTFLPFYHVFGLIAVYIWFAFFSRTFVQLNDLSPQTILNTIKRHKVTHIFAVPLFWETVYESALKTIKSRGEETYQKYLKGAKIAESLHDIPLIGKGFSSFAFKEIRDNLFGESVQFMISGGSNISTDVIAFFNNIGYRLVNGYGMTEIGITSVELSDKKKYLYDACVGKPIKFSEYKVDNNGELFVRGNSTAKYIIEDGIKKDNNDWYPTGDMAKCKNGHYYILSRKDDVVISGNGENINPFFVESAFLKTEGIKEACLIKSQSGGQSKPILIIRLENYVDKERIKEVSDNVLKAAGNSRFPKDGKIVYTKDALMRNEEFKLNRKKISQRFDNSEITLLDINMLKSAEEISDEMLAEIRALTAQILNKDERNINVDDDMFLIIGMTSLEYFSVISAINERYSVNLLQGENGNYRTLREIYLNVKEQAHSVV